MVPLVEKKSPANIPYSLIFKQIGICYIKDSYMYRNINGCPIMRPRMGSNVKECKWCFVCTLCSLWLKRLLRHSHSLTSHISHRISRKSRTFAEVINISI